MLPQTSAEAVHSAIYVQRYLDCVENFPDHVQRYLTRIRELDVTYRACIREAEAYAAAYTAPETSAARRVRALLRMKRTLIVAQEYGDEKLQLVQLVQEIIDNTTRELDSDYRNLKSCVEVTTNGGSEEAAPAAEPAPAPPPPAPAAAPPPRAASPAPPPPQEREKEKAERDKTGERWSKRSRRSRTTTGGNAGRDTAHTDGDSGRDEREHTERTSGQHNTTTHKKGIGKKKKRKARGSAAAAAAAAARAETPPEEPDAIDPDEPRYCLCDQISFGEMILCDNDLCPIEWFHFSCVYLNAKPKGKWFCPKCRGDRPNVMKPKGQFLKELERYNREKEEKA